MKLIFFALAALMTASSQAPAATPADSCVQDLRTIPPFLLENDAGARQHLAQKGQVYFDLALATATTAAAKVTNDKACDTVLNNYVHMWRKGHLDVITNKTHEAAQPATVPGTAGAQAAQSRAPSITILSGTTVLLHFPSFYLNYQAGIESLLDAHRAVLASHPNWIIDVRDNNGGSDASYMPLMPWIGSGETLTIGVEWLSTPANIAAMETSCALIAPGNETCKSMAEQVATQLRAVKPGQFVAIDSAEMNIYTPQPPSQASRPARVAILIDHECGSACEQFLLQARQSFHVKLLGRNTYGALDYSNISLHALPSGLRYLAYATSRSARLPSLQVDLGGIMPDIYLPPPKDDAARAQEIVRVQHWLEGGSLRPDGI